ncbi:MAG: PLP-dependent aminotransferase family protein [Candidatus Zixiibacteriota bacterium]|nr:MAG: PLP-dependent aminotransferase family protein [candidate division Zixibacteria bacterium]
MTTTWIPQLEARDEPTYRLIAEAIESDICDGILRPGSLLPTHRDLADKMGLAIGTVTRAYKEAEKKGLIRGDGRRGTIVETHGASGSVLSQLVDTVAHGNEVHRLPHGTELPDFARILTKLASDPESAALFRYPTVVEKDSHKRAGAVWLASLGLEVDPDQILCSVGAHHGILVTLASVTKPGDVVLAESHTYMGLSSIAALLNLRLISVEIDREGIIPDSFADLCRKKRVRALFSIPTVHSPTNATMSLNRRRELVSVADRHGVTIIEDNMLGPMMTSPPPPLKSLAPEICCLVTSATKVLCPGVKVGFVVPPDPLRQACLDVIRATTVRVPPLVAELFAHMMSDGTAQRVISDARREAGERHELAKRILPEGRVVSDPASYYIWILLPERWTASAFALAAMHRGVRVWPSDLFAIDKSSPARAVRYLIGPPANRGLLKQELEVLASLMLRDATAAEFEH